MTVCFQLNILTNALPCLIKRVLKEDNDEIKTALT